MKATQQKIFTIRTTPKAKYLLIKVLSKVIVSSKCLSHIQTKDYLTREAVARTLRSALTWRPFRSIRVLPLRIVKRVPARLVPANGYEMNVSTLAALSTHY